MNAATRTLPEQMSNTCRRLQKGRGGGAAPVQTGWPSLPQGVQVPETQARLCRSQPSSGGQQISPLPPQGGGAVQIPSTSTRSPSQMGASAKATRSDLARASVISQLLLRHPHANGLHERCEGVRCLTHVQCGKTHQGRWARPPCRMGEGGEQCRCRPHQSGLPRRWVPLQTQRCLIT